MLEHEPRDILGISESWLHSWIDDSELNINGYHKIIRNDRKSGRYGGVAIYCNKNYKHIDRKEWNESCNDIEMSWIEIYYHRVDLFIYVLCIGQKTHLDLL